MGGSPRSDPRSTDATAAGTVEPEQTPAEIKPAGKYADTDRVTAPRASDTTRSNPPRQGADPEPAVRLVDVTHHFGEVAALFHLDLEVPSGRITVLLGPNGAGKTTTIRAITGAVRPYCGSVRTFGVDPAPEDSDVRGRCGVVSAKPALYERLSGFDNLLYAAQLYGLRGDLDATVRDAAARFGIEQALDDQVGGYSTGMKTRLALSRSILHEPELLLFDEPTSGLDPESSLAVLDMIRELTADGRTVVMCTHLLAEAEGLADHVVLMEGGHSLRSGTAESLVGSVWPNPALLLGARRADQLDRVATLQGVLAYERLADGTAVAILDGEGRVPAIVEHLVRDGVELTRVEPLRATLEDLYFALRATRRAGRGLATVASATASRRQSFAEVARELMSGNPPVAPNRSPHNEDEPLTRTATTTRPTEVTR